VLKTGIILKNYIKPSSNKTISELLKFCYGVRSAIVHGNEEKILTLLNTIKQKNIKWEKIIPSSKNKNDNKNKALIFCEVNLLMFSRAVIKYWLENTTVIDYIKEN